MPLGHGYTIEEQITSQAKQGGIQIDVYPLLESAVKFKDEIGSGIDIRMCPCELRISSGRQISMHLKWLPMFNDVAHRFDDHLAGRLQVSHWKNI